MKDTEVGCIRMKGKNNSFKILFSFLISASVSGQRRTDGAGKCRGKNVDFFPL